LTNAALVYAEMCIWTRHLQGFRNSVPQYTASILDTRLSSWSFEEIDMQKTYNPELRCLDARAWLIPKHFPFP